MPTKGKWSTGVIGFIYFTLLVWHRFLGIGETINIYVITDSSMNHGCLSQWNIQFVQQRKTYSIYILWNSTGINSEFSSLHSLSGSKIEVTYFKSNPWLVNVKSEKCVHPTHICSDQDKIFCAIYLVGFC